MSDLSAFRARKDEFFRSSPQSPLTEEQRAGFQGLRYYDEEPGLVFVVSPEPFAEQEPVEMQTSTGDSAQYIRWARVMFEVEGRAVALTIYREPGEGHLFLPFQDANRGGETYGAGRYLEVDALPGGRVRLDFNYAYNPYCAYNDNWSCPLPPPENRLDVPIRAGEKT